MLCNTVIAIFFKVLVSCIYFLSALDFDSNKLFYAFVGADGKVEESMQMLATVEQLKQDKRKAEVIKLLLLC